MRRRFETSKQAAAVADEEEDEMTGDSEELHNKSSHLFMHILLNASFQLLSGDVGVSVELSER